MINRIMTPDDLVVNIEKSWSDDHGIYLKGYILHKAENLDKVFITSGTTTVEITNWHERPDVIRANLWLSKDVNCGFSVYIPHFAEHLVSITAHVKEETFSRTIQFHGLAPEKPAQYSEGGHLFNEFIRIVNENELSVLEIGSRIVSPGSSSKRSLFPRAKSYTGFDIYPDSNTDVVGDAHKLSRYFKNEKFDAVFSLSVFEHLAMPWVVAKEINTVLKTGGVTFHASHFSYPLHEMPWDFFRYSDEGFKALFPAPMGFRTITSGLFHPVRMYFDDAPPPGQEEVPFFCGFAGVAILTEKISDVDVTRFCWDTSIEEVLGNNSFYPKK